MEKNFCRAQPAHGLAPVWARTIVGSLLGLVAFAAPAAEPADLSAPNDKLSYSIGASIGKNLKKDNPEINVQVLIEGFKAAFQDQKLRLSDKDIRIVMGEYQTRLRQTAMAQRQQAMETNKKAGDAYLAANLGKPGVVVLPSGLQYRVVKAGNGPIPKLADSVLVSYRGTLINGTEFDATPEGKPMPLRVAGLITGWKEALVRMPVGSVWELAVPSALAYGERGAGDIGPNETLLFRLELTGIQ